MHRQLFCSVLLALVGPLSVFGEAPFRFADTPGKLPKDVVPKSYDIQIKPVIAQRTFTGSETVVIEVSKPTKTITLNAHALTIPSAKLLSADGKVEQTAKVSLDAKEQIATLAFDSEVAAGTHQLALDFAGKINEAGEGLYYATYQEEGSGAKKTMLGTQMEATDARRMFPCWDEPSFRARFRLTATVPDNFTAVSNMPIEQEKTVGAEKEVRFGETPPMASYLVVFVAGELDAIHGEADGVKIGVVTTKGKAETGRYALESAEKILHYYDEYFGIKYPLPKLDLIAVPGGFGGAMENWGGIVFFESGLLFDPAKSSEEAKENIFEVEAHEMAHQWFGDLVTMAWWDNLWLNEGFASWMGTKCSDHFNPQWDVWLRANLSKQHAMATDALSATHPIQQPVKTEAEADSAFDEITYQKGQAFLRMLESYLGADVFRAGIRDYMQAHKLSNSTTADLWNALATASKKPVSEVAASWTEQPGLPLVSLQTSNSGLTISQTRFTVHQKDPTPLTWKIPVVYHTLPIGPNDADAKVILLEKESAALPGLAPAQTVKLNAGNLGYYRVQYDPAHFRQLLAAAAQLPDADKVNLLSDSWALVKADRGSIADYFQLVEAVRADDNLAVWEQITDALSYIDGLYRGSNDRAAYQAYARSILNPVFDRVGWEPQPNEKATTGLLRVELISILGEFGDPAVRAGARSRFEKFLGDPKTLVPALRPAVFDVVARSADRKTWDQLHQLGLTTKNAGEKGTYYHALALSPDFTAEALALSLGTELPATRAARLVASVSLEGEKPALAWKFLQKNRTALDAKLDSLGEINFLPQVASGFNEAARADELEAYARKTLPPGAHNPIDKAAEGIRFRADFKARLLPEIAKWIAAHKAPAQPTS
ncbi:MAG: M1 family metallopeptidase [Chthoniobacterales bacterium]